MPPALYRRVPFRFLDEGRPTFRHVNFPLDGIELAAVDAAVRALAAIETPDGRTVTRQGAMHAAVAGVLLDEARAVDIWRISASARPPVTPAEVIAALLDFGLHRIEVAGRG